MAENIPPHDFAVGSNVHSERTSRVRQGNSGHSLASLSLLVYNLQETQNLSTYSLKLMSI